MSKDWTGNRTTTFVQLGASNHSEKEREENDFYATDPQTLKIFLRALKRDKIELHQHIWECACGKGHLSEVLKAEGYDVYSSDLIDRNYGEQKNFLTSYNTWGGGHTNKPTLQICESVC